VGSNFKWQHPMNEAARVSRGVVLTGWVALGFTFCVPLWVPVARAATNSNAAPDPVRAGRQGGASTLEDRVTAFAKALELDPVQQARLRKVLMEQREAVRKIWSDRALLPAERVPATRAANERTGDEIRSILSDDQKKKYNPPMPSSPPERGDTRSVEQWLDATRSR
jgi:hypothetical protein